MFEGVGAAAGKKLAALEPLIAFDEQELAARVGVSQVTVSHWERGEEYPGFAHLAALGAVVPEVLRYAHEEEIELLRRLLRAERLVFAGTCSCEGCGCAS